MLRLNFLPTDYLTKVLGRILAKLAESRDNHHIHHNRNRGQLWG